MRFISRAIALLGMMATASLAWAQDAATPEPAETPKARTILVLDASGSMWGQIEGQNKIVIAREVVGDLMQNWDPAIHLGLTAYGHNTKGDCSDIEELVPVGAGTMARITEIVNGINPKGKTPLSEAVRQAADSLKYTEEAATVILVTDGLETCDADPCAVAKALEESGIDFTTHVVGFDITEEESQQIRCLAENTGGQYFSAGNAAELKDALGSVVTEVQSAAETDIIHVTWTEGGEPIEDIKIGFEYFKAEDAGKKDRKYIGYGYGGKGYPKVAPGDYVVQVKLGAAVVEAPFEVLADERREHMVNLNAGRLSALAKLDEDSETDNGNLAWEIFAIGDDGKVAGRYTSYAYGPNPQFVLPAGNYSVQVKKGAAVATEPQEIVAGDEHELVIDLRAGVLKFDAVLKEGAAPYTGQIGWEAFSVGEDGKRAERYSAYSYGPNGSYTLSAGKYALKAKVGAVERWLETDVPPGEETSVTVVLNGGTLSFDAILKEGAAPFDGKVGWEAFAVGDDGKPAKHYSAYSYGPNGTYTLPEGRFALKAKAGAIERWAEADVKAAEDSRVTVLLDGGWISFDAVLSEGGEPVGDKVGWEAFPVGEDGKAADRYVSYSYGPTGEYLVPSGEYEMKAKLGSIVATGRGTVTAGENTKVRVNLNGGRIEGVITDENGNKLPGKPAWDVRAVKDGKVMSGNVAYGYSADFVRALPAGTYEIQAKQDNRTGVERFEVVAGETIKLTVKTAAP